MSQNLKRLIAGSFLTLAALPVALAFPAALSTTTFGASARQCSGLTSLTMADRLPKLVAFDLDATLWSPEMYELWGGGSPFKKNSDGTLTDRSGRRCYLMGNSRQILHELKNDPKWKDTKVAVCSCTDEPSWADECMKKFEIGDGVPMEQAIDYHEIFKSTKTAHFKNLNKKTGIPFEDMIFFGHSAPSP